MSIINSIRSQLSPIHPQGYPFVGSFALASIILFWLWPPFGWLGTVVTLWCAYFFRDPPRVTPAREKLALVDDEPAAPNRNPPAVENGAAEPPAELPIDRADAAE